MPRELRVRLAIFVLAFLTWLPSSAPAQEGAPPLGPAGPQISLIDLANRLYEVGLRNTEYLATLELSLRSSGDLWSVFHKSSPQGLFVTVEVEDKLIKDIAKNDKVKVAEVVGPGALEVKGRFVRPGKRVEYRCFGELTVGFQQVVFLPYGGNDGNFSCVVAPRLLPDEHYDAWVQGLPAESAQAFSDCSAVNARGSSGFWSCIDGAGIPLPDVPVS